MNRPIKVLQILPALNYSGGIESYVMNYYRYIDRTKVQFDFITHTELEASYENEINSLGGSVFKFPVFSIGSLTTILKKIDNFFKFHNEYIAIHCHMANASPFYFFFAKKYGITNLILHSHQPSAADKLCHVIRNIPLLYLGNKLATKRVACSKLAGDFLFGKKKFFIIKNAFDINKYRFNKDVRKKIRRDLCLEGKFVIGHIGRLTAQKNQLFLLEIFKEVIKYKDNALLIMVGVGEDEEKIRKKILALGLQKKVIMLGSRADVNQLYQGFDYFVFPSLYEGLGIVLLEAQCSGLNILTGKENIPHEVKLSDSLNFLSLKCGSIEWAKHILENTRLTREVDLKNICEAGYDIHHEAIKLQKMYTEMSNA